MQQIIIDIQKNIIDIKYDTLIPEDINIILDYYLHELLPKDIELYKTNYQIIYCKFSSFYYCKCSPSNTCKIILNYLTELNYLNSNGLIEYLPESNEPNESNELNESNEFKESNEYKKLHQMSMTFNFICMMSNMEKSQYWLEKQSDIAKIIITIYEIFTKYTLEEIEYLINYNKYNIKRIEDN